MKALIEGICIQNNLELTNFSLVHGGDINEACRIETSSGIFFVKLNSAERFPEMFQSEQDGLTALRGKSNLTVPEVVNIGQIANKQYLLMEWLEPGTANRHFWQAFANGIAALHQHSNLNFGWHSSNYIGLLKQENEYAESWDYFYATQRIIPLCKRLFDAGVFNTTDISNGEALGTKLNQLFPEEKPALLHGDLWQGNFTKTGGGNTAIYDPAVYYGHREMDLGMAKLFGGFHESFFSHYHEAFPLEKDWKLRLPLSQLYPLLVHAILFGQGYVNDCRRILQHWH